MATEIPQPDLFKHACTVERAVQLAQQGREREGFNLLLEAFAQAQEEAEAGTPWKAELAARCQQVLLSYAEQHGIEL